jgi:hypothetical protein
MLYIQKSSEYKTGVDKINKHRKLCCDLHGRRGGGGENAHVDVQLELHSPAQSKLKFNWIKRKQINKQRKKKGTDDAIELNPTTV